jgi:D-serine deaminase-like pyridoxal phosphate-dependent protein
LPEEIPAAVEHSLIFSAHDSRLAAQIAAEARRQNRTAKVHLKIDSGMGRLGVLPELAPVAPNRFSRWRPGWRWKACLCISPTRRTRITAARNSPRLTALWTRWRKSRPRRVVTARGEQHGGDPLLGSALRFDPPGRGNVWFL